MTKIKNWKRTSHHEEGSRWLSENAKVMNQNGFPAKYPFITVSKHKLRGAWYSRIYSGPNNHKDSSFGTRKEATDFAIKYMRSH